MNTIIKPTRPARLLSCLQGFATRDKVSVAAFFNLLSSMAEIEIAIVKLIIVRSLKLLEINRMPAFYIHQYGKQN